VSQVWAVRDELWETAQSLLPERKAQHMGRPRVEDRVAFNAIVYVLVTGIAWRYLPRELGCSPATAHRRLQEWERAGVWPKLYSAVLARLEQAGGVDRSTVIVDGSHIRALQGGLDRAVAG
jgi:transposase